MDYDIEAVPPARLEVFEEVTRAIVVCAHADDMETMMGGTVALLAEQGVEIFELICTLGDLGSQDEAETRDDIADRRKREAEEGAKLLSLRGLVTMNHHDGELEATLELRAQIAEYYRKWQPDTLFTFDPDWGGQIHPDHRASARAAIDAIMPSRMRLYKPNQLRGAQVANIKKAFIFSPASPSIFVDVTGFYDRKLRSCLAHVSQFPEGAINLEWMRERDRAAARRAGDSGRYYEEFSELRIW